MTSPHSKHPIGGWKKGEKDHRTVKVCLCPVNQYYPFVYKYTNASKQDAYISDQCEKCLGWYVGMNVNYEERI